MRLRNKNRNCYSYFTGYASVDWLIDIGAPLYAKIYLTLVYIGLREVFDFLISMR